ncbi:MAG: YciI family protein [Rhizobiales bacterium]|nr:YciI family protein [Hyphomicrobiales bacterium]
MHFMLHGLDKPDALPVRLAHYDAHRAYIAAAPVKIIVSGPLVSDDGTRMIGSFILMEAESRDQVVAFNRADPFYQAGVWERVDIHRCEKRVDNRA